MPEETTTTTTTTPAATEQPPSVGGNRELVEYYKRVQKLEDQLREIRAAKVPPTPTETAPTSTGADVRLAIVEAVADGGVALTRRQRDLLSTMAEKERPPDVAAWVAATVKELGWAPSPAASVSVTPSPAASPPPKPTVTGPPAVTVGARQLPGDPRMMTPEEWRGLSATERDQYMTSVNASRRHVTMAPAHMRKR